MARLTLRIPDDLHRRLEESAAKSRTSLNQMILSALADYLDGDGRFLDEDPLRSQVAHIRAALRDVLVDLPLGEDSETAAEVILPALTPPISSTIIEERRDRF